MNLKKLLMTVFACVMAGTGMAQTPETVFLSPTEIKTKLERNEILPSIYLSPLGGATKNKSVLGKLAQEQVVKHGNYVAYYNAAVIYFTDRDFYDNAHHDLTATDLANVQKYATKAIRLSPKTPDMYFVRGMVINRYLNLDELSNLPPSAHDDYAKKVENNRAQVSTMLKDFEKVGELQPSMAPWGTMAALYEALGQKENAKRCMAKYNTYTKIAEEKARKANHVQQSVQTQMNPAAKKSGAHAGALPVVKSYNKAGTAASLPPMAQAGARAAVGGPGNRATQAGAVSALDAVRGRGVLAGSAVAARIQAGAKAAKKAKK